MERRKLPPGTLLYLPWLPPETTVDDIVDFFDRAGVWITADRVEIRPLKLHPDRVAANISLPNGEVAKLLQATFARHGTRLPNQHYSRDGWKVKVAPFGSTKEDKTYHSAPAQIPSTDNAWPPHNVERRG